MIRIVREKKLRALKEENKALKKEKLRLKHEVINVESQLSKAKNKLYKYKEKEFKVKAKSLGIDHETMSVSDFEKYDKFDSELFHQAMSGYPLGSVKGPVMNMARIDQVPIQNEMEYLIERAKLHNNEHELAHLEAWQCTQDYCDLIHTMKKLQTS